MSEDLAGENSLGFWQLLWDNLFGVQWWADNLPSYIIFTLLITFFITRVSKYRDWRHKYPYKNWSLRVVGFDDEEQKLHWQEVELFMNSDFEKWKFVKSVVSGVCHVTPRTSKSAEKEKWIVHDGLQSAKLFTYLALLISASAKKTKEKSYITVDFTKIPENHISKWLVDDLPDGWQWKTMPKPEPSETIRKAVKVEISPHSS